MDADIIKIIKEYIGNDIIVTNDSDLVLDLNLTSYDSAMIFSLIKEKYPCEIDFEKITNLKKVSDIKNCLIIK